jgi:hypothetical protein
MKAKIEIRMDNAAFEDSNGSELAIILRDIARRVDTRDMTPHTMSIRDSNGNTVGSFKIVRG